MKKILLFILMVVSSFCILGVHGVDAATINEGTDLYLVPNANWNDKGARFAAYFIGNGDAWADATLVEGETNIYKVTSPRDGFTGVIFCRMNPDTKENNWDKNNMWNQTSDLVYDGTNNCYTITEGAWNKGNGTWSIFTKAKLTAAISFEYSYENSNSGKIYFTNSADWDKVYCHMWGDGGVKTEWPGNACTVVKENDGYGHKVYSCDIIEGAKFAIFNNGGNGSQTGNIPLSDISSQYFIYDGLKQCVYDDSVNIVLEKVELMFALKHVDKLTGYEKYKIEVKCGVKTQTSEEFAATGDLKNLVVKVNVTGHETEEITAVLYGVNGVEETKLDEVVYSAKTVAQTYFDSYATNDAVMKHWNAIAAITALPSAE